MATIKQKLSFKKVLKGMPIKHAMLEVKYAPSTANTTGKLTRSKGWKELTDKYISEEALMKVHKEGLSATTKKPHLIDRDDKGRPVYEYVPETDFSTRHKYLATGYKVRGRMKEQDGGNKTLILMITGETASRYGITSTPITSQSS